MNKVVDLPEDFQIYGWTPKDVLTVQRWLMAQNATLEDLKCSSLNRHYWEKQKVAQMIMDDFCIP